MVTFSVATVRVDDVPTPVLQVGERRWALADVAPEALAPDPARGLMNVFERWDRTEPLLVAVHDALSRGQHAAPLPPLSTPEDVLAPLRYPRKAIFSGANYYDHVRNDAGYTDFDKATKIPLFFLKPPTTTFVGGGRSVRYPVQSVKFDYELELALVIGKRGRRLTLDEAMDHVAGYTIAMDLSARDWQLHPKHIAQFDMFAGKVFDDSCPLGPAIVPARYVDPEDLELEFLLNGEVRQRARTKDMIWSIAEQLVNISQHVTLEPGDVVSTGTPAGVGLATGDYLKVGDELEGRITGLGTLKVQIIPAE